MNQWSAVMKDASTATFVSLLLLATIDASAKISLMWNVPKKSPIQGVRAIATRRASAATSEMNTTAIATAGRTAMMGFGHIVALWTMATVIR